MTRLITITSGKGGVGKTNISINLALQLAARGFRTCLFDADLGLANINVLLGVYPQKTLREVLFSNQKIQEIIINYRAGVHILPGSSGVAEMVDLKPEQVEQLIRSFLALTDYDFFLFDTSAGIARDVLAFCLAAPEVLVVITPEPTSLTDAYALVKILVLSGFHGKIRIVVNLCRNASHAKAAYGKFKAAVKKFLGVDITSLGMIYEDEMMPRAVTQQQPVSILYPKAHATQCIKKLADRLAAESEDSLEPRGLKAFWEQCLAVLKHPPVVDGKLKIGPEAEEAPEKPIQIQAGPAEPTTADPARSASRTQTEISITAEDNRPGMTPPAAIRSEVTESSQTDPTIPGNNNPDELIPQVIEKLTGSLNLVVEELAKLRQSVEKMGSLSRPENHTDLQSKPTKAESIALDFETYIKSRQPQGKDLQLWPPKP